MSRHTVSGQMNEEARSDGKLLVPPRDGKPTLTVAYFFSGIQRKASVANCLARLCRDSGFGLAFHEVDILVGGGKHDLMNLEAQQSWLDRIEKGEFCMVLLSPPCGTWSRANYSNKPGPQPCRSKRYPWGFPHAKARVKARAQAGNAFVHFSIRAIMAAQNCKRKGYMTRCLIEHPEDLGATGKGIPASIWQLRELRTAFAEFDAASVAGHQCQFPDCDRRKPTRLFSDLSRVGEFGWTAWPSFDRQGFYKGPLPASCGHNHRQKMIGLNDKGGFNTSPTAAYPPGMCSAIANWIFHDFTKLARDAPYRRGKSYNRTRVAGTEPVVGDEVCERIPGEAMSRTWDKVKLISAAETRDINEKLDDNGINVPAREGIDKLLDNIEVDADGTMRTRMRDNPGFDVNDDSKTTDEEQDLPGIMGPRKGNGWWGRGPPLSAYRKGVDREINDGAGFPSPGRWRVKD